MCTNPITIRCKASIMDNYRGLTSDRYLQVPCGKCAECLSKRQNDLSVRVYNEAQAKGFAVFVTLTYRPSDVPVAHSLWCVNRDTGEMEMFDNPEPLFDDSLEVVRSDIAKVKRDVPIIEKRLEYSDYVASDFIVRYTPTLYYRDVQLALKRFRKNNKDLPDFSYVFVGEYGSSPFGAHRPHYHCIFFGLNTKQVYKFCDEWKYGFYSVKQVKFINKDGSNGLERVSRYVGKYCSKGKFDVCTKRDGLTLKSRMCSSKGLGLSDSFKRLQDWYLGRDVFEYDPVDLSSLQRDYINKICALIMERQGFTLGNCKYGLPLSFKNFIFGKRTIKQIRDYPTQFKNTLGFKGKTVYFPIFYEYQDFVRNLSLQDDERKLVSFGFDGSAKSLSKAVYLLEKSKQIDFEIREKNKERTILRFYQQHSKF